MLLKTILNYVDKNIIFVYKKIQLVENGGNCHKPDFDIFIYNK